MRVVLVWFGLMRGERVVVLLWRLLCCVVFACCLVCVEFALWVLWLM